MAKKKRAAGKSATKRVSKTRAAANPARRLSKKGGGRKPAATFVKASPSPNAARPGRRRTSNPDTTRALWSLIKKSGASERNTQRPLFDTSVQLRHLDGADIARMVSGAKIGQF